MLSPQRSDLMKVFQNENLVSMFEELFRNATINDTQGSPTAKTVAATLTIAELRTGILTGTHATGANINYTLPTGTLTDAGLDFVDDDSFDWTLINLSAAAADTITIAAGVDHAVVGMMIVQANNAATGALYGNTGTFRTRKTAPNTYVTYRIG